MNADTCGISTTQGEKEAQPKKMYKYTWKWMLRIPLQNVLVVPLLYSSYLKSSLLWNKCMPNLRLQAYTLKAK